MVIPVLREVRQVEGELRVNLQHCKILSKIIYQILSNALAVYGSCLIIIVFLEKLLGFTFK